MIGSAGPPRRTGQALPSHASLPGVHDVSPAGTATAGHAISYTSTPLRDTTPDDPPCLWRRTGLRGRSGRRGWGTLVCGLGLPLAWGPHETAAEEIETRPSKHLAFEHLEAIDMALDRSSGPRQRHARFDCRIVIAQPLGKALQDLQGTRAGALQPRIQMRGLPLTDQGGKVLCQVDRLGHR